MSRSFNRILHNTDKHSRYKVLSLHEVKKRTTWDWRKMKIIKQTVQISKCYQILSGTSPSQPFLIEHSCLMTPGNEWDMEVKCRPISHGAQGVSNQRNNWRSLMMVYPEAKVQLKHNDIEVTLPSLQEDVEIAAFGRPGKDDKKRMQMAIFAKRPKQGRDWKIWVYLVDDTSPACEKMFQDEDEKGNKLLTPLAGIFVSKSNEDIKIELSKLEPGWKIRGSNVKTIKSTHAWNSSGNAVDFPRCYFEISHVNSAKHSFFCGIEASHEGDSAQAEVVAYFERESGQKIVQPSNNSRKLSNTCNFVSKESNTRFPLLEVFFLLCALFASDFNITHITAGSNSTYQQFTTKKDFKDFTNIKPPDNFPSIGMPYSGELVKRGQAGSASCGSTVPQDPAHCATARNPNTSERGFDLSVLDQRVKSTVVAVVRCQNIWGLEKDEDYKTKVQISGCHKINSGTSPSQLFLIEHCCLMTPRNKWDMEVKCSPMSHGAQDAFNQRYNWGSLMVVSPEAKVQLKHNDIEVTLPSLQEDVEIAAFGRPGKDDKKRMQMAIFAKQPKQGRDWQIWVYLVDETSPACEKMFQDEDERGNRLLTPLAGIFVSKSNKDITTELSKLEPGWKIKGSNVKTIKSTHAWNLSGNSVDFPPCYFEISHVNSTKNSFLCEVEASHEGDSGHAEVVAYFDRESGQKIIQPSNNSRKLSNTWNFVSKETNTRFPLHDVFSLLTVLFAADFNITHVSGSNSTYQQFITEKDFEDFTNIKPPDNFPAIGMPRSGALVKREQAEFASCSSTVPQDQGHCATARKTNASEQGFDLSVLEQRVKSTVVAVVRCQNISGLEKDEDYKTDVQISSCYKILSGTSPSHPILIEHSFLMTPGNESNMEIKCRPISHGAQGVSNQRSNWRSLMVVYPEAEVQLKNNGIEVTLPSQEEDVEIAAFGRPGKDDKKRMQMAIFAKQLKQGRDWQIWVYLVDDTSPACEKMFLDEDERGNKLLTPLAGIFVSKSNKDITIELSKLEPGWKIKGSNVKTIKSTHAWNSSGNSVDFPRCYFEISHVNSTKNSFFCEIEASHEGDSAHAEVVAYFEQESGQRIVQPSNNPRKLSDTWNFVSKETNTTFPLHEVFSLLNALFATDFNTTHVAGSNSTYQQFTTEKDFEDFTNIKPPDNFPAIGMPRSGALVKRGQAGFASCSSTVPQDQAHCATARKTNASEIGFDFSVLEQRVKSTVVAVVRCQNIRGLEKDEDYKTEVQISGCYKILSGTSQSNPILIEHSCVMTPGNEWDMEIKCRPILHGPQGVSNQRSNWRSLMVVYPEAEVQSKHNDIEVTLPSLQEDVEIAAFGRSRKDDKKRMQMAIFAKQPKQGRDWKIWVYLVDDTSPACEKMFQDEDERGNKLLTPLAGIFVSKSNKDIKIELSNLEPGWKIRGSNVKTIKSTHAWNSLGNSVDFPRCYFEISHVNSTKHSFFCGIEASHEGDIAQAEVVAYFERESGQKIFEPSNNSRKLSNTCNFVSKETNTRFPLHEVFFLLCALFASGFNTTHLTGSNSTYQQFTTKKNLQDLTNSKPPDNFPSTGMPRSGALVKRRKAGFASCGSTVQQDHVHCATSRKPNASERGNTIQIFQKQSSQEVY